MDYIRILLIFCVFSSAYIYNNWISKKTENALLFMVKKFAISHGFNEIDVSSIAYKWGRSFVEVTFKAANKNRCILVFNVRRKIPWFGAYKYRLQINGKLIGINEDINKIEVDWVNLVN